VKLIPLLALAVVLVLLASPKRLRLIAAMDWPTLVFFAAMFVLMRSVWDSGLPEWALRRGGADLSSLELVMAVALVGSQIVSNVPLVALLLPVLRASPGAGPAGLVALGAASNVIVIQNAERRTGDTVPFLDFLRVGAPLTALQAAAYWGYLKLFS